MVVAASEFDVEVRLASETDQAVRRVQGLAVHQRDRWVAIAVELGTVAEGDSAEQALDHLEGAVRDSLDIASEEGLPTGRPVSAGELKELLGAREPLSAPVTMRTFSIAT